jgi:serine/threonine protein kinase
MQFAVCCLLPLIGRVIFFFCTQNVIHGDIKPDNLLVTSTGNVKIGDFSVSQVFEVVSLVL